MVFSVGRGLACKYYLVALNAVASIFRKGASSISHQRPESYYKCLVHMRDISALEALGGQSAGDRAYAQLLTGVVGEPSVAGALADEAEA
eukprot:4374157-Alexandrium_andersonii.AAC.1